MIEKEWNDCLFCNIYQANKDGQIRNKRTGKILKAAKQKTGYLLVILSNGEVHSGKLVHRLVYEAFNGPIPEGMQVNHINEDKTDNRLENLNLMAPKENSNWGSRNERLSKKMLNREDEAKSIVQYDLEGNIVKDNWFSQAEIERVLGFKQQNISACCRGKIPTYKGFVWRFKEC